MVERLDQGLGLAGFFSPVQRAKAWIGCLWRPFLESLWRSWVTWSVSVSHSIRRSAFACDLKTRPTLCGRLGLRPGIEYSGGERGWIGDNPFIFLDCSRIRALGWKPRLAIREGIVRTLDYLAQNRFLLAVR